MIVNDRKNLFWLRNECGEANQISEDWKLDIPFLLLLHLLASVFLQDQPTYAEFPEAFSNSPEKKKVMLPL